MMGWFTKQLRIESSCNEWVRSSHGTYGVPKCQMKQLHSVDQVRLSVCSIVSSRMSPVEGGRETRVTDAAQVMTT